MSEFPISRVAALACLAAVGMMAVPASADPSRSRPLVENVPNSFRVAPCAQRRACTAGSKCVPAKVRAADGIVNGSWCRPDSAAAGLMNYFGTVRSVRTLNQYMGSNYAYRDVIWPPPFR